MAKNNGSNGKANLVEADVDPEVKKQALKHEVKRLMRECDKRHAELEKTKDDYRICVVLYCSGRKTKKELREARGKITEAEKLLDDANGQLTIAKVKLERTEPRKIQCRDCLKRFTPEMFQMHIDVAKNRGIHCEFYRQAL